MTSTVSSATDLTGQMIIAGSPVRGTGAEIRGFDPSTGTELDPGVRMLAEILEDDPVELHLAAEHGRRAGGRHAGGSIGLLQVVRPELDERIALTGAIGLGEGAKRLGQAVTSGIASAHQRPADSR